MTDPTRAPACIQALADANAVWPNRARASDGILGDAAHQATNSDHNTGDAVDITHDPSTGPSGATIALHAIRDPRSKYVIYNRAIYNITTAGWRDYQAAATKPHTSHVHISILPGSRDNKATWGWNTPGAAMGSADAPILPPAEMPDPPLANGASGELVKLVQTRLQARGWSIIPDGEFGGNTEAVLKRFQRARALPATGKLDEATWRTLWAAVFQPLPGQ